MKTQTNKLASRRDCGFTLIELIGVLAIATILITFGVRSSMTRVNQGYRDQEVIALDSLANSLTEAARSTRYIPAATNWSSTLAAQMVIAEVQVSQNRANNARSFLIDPAISITLPYVQTGTGMSSFTTAGGSAVAPPTNLRFIFLSSVGTPLPALTGITFDTIWNTAPNALPVGWPSSWKGNVADLLIRRVDLRGALVRLVLNNLDAANNATWQVDGAPSPLTLPGNSQKIAWYFAGSFLSLYDQGGLLVSREVLNADASYTLQRGEWGPHLTTNGQGPGADLAQAISDFLKTPARPPSSSRCGAEQHDVADEMCNYLRHYSTWSRSGFPRSDDDDDHEGEHEDDDDDHEREHRDDDDHPDTQVPKYRHARECQDRLRTYSSNLCK